MIQIMKAGKIDLKDIISFYKQCGYNGGAKKDDTVLIAKEDNLIVGSVRLCIENNTLVLRGMYISDKYQKRGIGTKLLNQIDKTIKSNECYCLPYAHLEEFYTKIGFQQVRTSDAPPFLQDRLKKYENTGSKIIIMKRSGHIA